MGDQKTELVFQIWEDEVGVFFTKEAHRRFRQIEKALQTAKTWEDFERLCPEGEFEALSLWWQNDGEHVYVKDDRYLYIDSCDMDEFWKLCGEEYLIRDSDRFERSRVPGADEGDYPSFDVADDLLPSEFVNQFGEQAVSMVSGSWFQFHKNDLSEMMRWLASAGFSVEAELEFEMFDAPD